MTSKRLPAGLLSVTALAFLVWSVVLVGSPGGSIVLEWVILAVSLALLGVGLWSWRSDDQQRASLIRWLLTAFALFGGVVVIGLTADQSSSRTWVRLGWAALLAGLVTALVAWWNAPRVKHGPVIAGGVVGLVVIASGLGITLNCDESLQRSWCDPRFEQEDRLAARIEVNGELERSGRAAGQTGPATRAYFIDVTDIEAVTRVPSPFTYEERPLQSIEVSRGRYTAASGPDANCQVDVKIETIPAGNLQTLSITCGATEG